jgi:hypothetical protein
MFIRLGWRCVAGVVLLASSGFTVNAAASSGLAIDEDHAVATLSGENLRLHLPLTQPAPADTTLHVRLLSPKNEELLPIEQDVRPGAAAIDLSIPQLDKAARGRAGTIEWYRIAWSIETSGKEISHGILSVGASHATSSRFLWPRPAKRCFLASHLRYASSQATR